MSMPDLKKYFAKNDVDRVYLNFSDPWPKTRHEKRRLTYKDFLNFMKIYWWIGEKFILKRITKGYLNTP